MLLLQAGEQEEIAWRCIASCWNLHKRGGEKSRKSCVSRQGRPEAGTPSEKGQSRGLAWMRPKNFAGEQGEKESIHSSINRELCLSLVPGSSQKLAPHNGPLDAESVPNLSALSSVSQNTASQTDTAYIPTPIPYSPTATGSQGPFPLLPEEGQFFLIPDKVIMLLPTTYQ